MSSRRALLAERRVLTPIGTVNMGREQWPTGAPQITGNSGAVSRIRRATSFTGLAPAAAVLSGILKNYPGDAAKFSAFFKCINARSTCQASCRGLPKPRWPPRVSSSQARSRSIMVRHRQEEFPPPVPGDKISPIRSIAQPPWFRDCSQQAVANRSLQSPAPLSPRSNHRAVARDPADLCHKKV